MATKTDFVTKQNCLHISDVEKLLHMTDFSPCLPCGDISPTDNLSSGDFLHMSICHVEKFLHMADFSPQALLVVLVTNIRYALRYKLRYGRTVEVDHFCFFTLMQSQLQYRAAPVFQYVLFFISAGLDFY